MMEEFQERVNQPTYCDIAVESSNEPIELKAMSLQPEAAF
jgi:hypothetical protein